MLEGFWALAVVIQIWDFWNQLVGVRLTIFLLLGIPAILFAGLIALGLLL
jgi:hypothetical protein